MHSSLYDEFGNYIGPDVDKSSDEDVEVTQHQEEPEVEEEVKEILQEYTTNMTVAEYYPSAQEVYGDGVEIIVGDVDTKPLSEPIVAPVIDKGFDQVMTTIPQLTFDFDFLVQSSTNPSMVRNVSLLGNFHEGKTLLCDILVEHTHLNLPKQLTKFTDYREDERGREISVKAVPVSLVLQDLNHKSWMFTVLDVPGHPNFVDEAIGSLRATDNVLLVVDVLNGVSTQTKRMVYLALSNNQQMCLILNCIDRLCLELRLPPKDAYFKLKAILAQVNSIVQDNCELLGMSHPPLNPVRGNVAFASGAYGFFFTLQSFATIYSGIHDDLYHSQMRTNRGMKSRERFNSESLVKMLWGDLYFNEDNRKFGRLPPSEDSPRSFVQFVLDPLWKLIVTVLGEEKPTLSAILADLGVRLKNSDYNLMTKDLLKVVCSKVFGKSSQAFTSMIVEHGIPPNADGGTKLRDIYNGSIGDSTFSKQLLNLDPNGILMANSVKNFHKPDCKGFDVLVRIYSGTLRKRSPYKVLGPAYTSGNTEDSVIRTITNLWIFNGRYRYPIEEAYPGMIVLVEGIDDATIKTVTLVGLDHEDQELDVETFKQLQLSSYAMVKVSCEPIRPSELPSMILGIRALERSYLMLRSRVEDSGEHVLMGSGEIMFDCVLHDLRVLYGELEVKVSDPTVTLQETVIEESSIKGTARTTNLKNRISMTCCPLDPKVVAALETNKLNNSMDLLDQARVLQEQYDWDQITSKSVWCFGPVAGGGNGTCCLMDETLPGTVDRALKSEGREFIVQGFQWGAREGPLIEEPIRQVKFSLMELELADDPLQRPGGQIVPTTRRSIYSAFLLATPRLMEPIIFAEITCSANAVAGVYNVLARRRGYVIADSPKAGTPLFVVHAYIPALDAFGFETDVRTHTSGQASILQFFDHWSLLPGDPLDRSILLRPLEPAPAPHLAREYLLKTRRRKGLTDDVHAHKIFDAEMLNSF